MLTPQTSTIIMLSLAALLLVVVPMMDSHPKLGKYISLRYTLVAVLTVLGVGAVLDFSHLETESRNIVLIGTFILVGLFVAFRSFEKMKLGGKTIEVEAHKGDLGGSVKVKGSEENKEKK